MGKWFFGLSVLLLLAACGSLLTPIGTTGIKNNSRWHRRQFPIVVGITKNVGSCRAKKIREAADAWNRGLRGIGVTKPAFVVRDASQIRSSVGTVWVTEGALPQKPNGGDTLGICQLGYYGTSSTLWGGSIKLNNKYCLLRVSIHELGHALGLRHAPDECLRCVMRHQVPKHEGFFVDSGWIRASELYYVAAQMTR